MTYDKLYTSKRMLLRLQKPNMIMMMMMMMTLTMMMMMMMMMIMMIMMIMMMIMMMMMMMMIMMMMIIVIIIYAVKHILSDATIEITLPTNISKVKSHVIVVSKISNMQQNMTSSRPFWIFDIY